MALNTLDHVRRLEAAGASRPPAEAHAGSLIDALGDVATKGDLGSLANELKLGER